PVSVWQKFRNLFLHSYIIAPLVILLFITGTAYASADALPGDTLYNVKRTVEDARVVLAPTADSKLQLQLEFAQKRLQELETLRANENPKQPDAVNDDSNKDKSSETFSIDAQDDNANADQNQRNNNHDQKKIRQNSNRQNIAKQEAKKAIENLEGNKNRTQQFNDKLKDLNKQLQDDDDKNDDSGSRTNTGSLQIKLLPGK
ncbi:MAG TPA: DUF5667 domain-containing protein, partial [Patescibacteria group bacterium]|nr:DUF5667 domain-containing protein [Patescibacteria group bacterium]